MTPNRSTHYSQRDIEEARGSLALLKKRISNSRDRGLKTGQTIDPAGSQYNAGGPQATKASSTRHASSNFN